jgi:hypothetical protein
METEKRSKKDQNTPLWQISSHILPQQPKTSQKPHFKHIEPIPNHKTSEFKSFIFQQNSQF